MLYQSQKMRLECVRTILRGSVNDILICRDLAVAVGSLYTLLVIKEHQTARRYLEAFERAGLSAQDSYIDSFSAHGALCMVFEYRRERPIRDFYAGLAYALPECEEVCINLVVTCMACGLPFPILYLVLKQDQLNLSKDRTVYLGYQIDLSELDMGKTERDCAVLCASIIRELLRPKASLKAFSFQLLEKKISRRSYGRFTELYKDIRISAAPMGRLGIRKRFLRWFAGNEDAIFHFLLAACSVLVAVAGISLLSQLIFGDIPWLRIFFNGFKTIGTETLS